MSTAKRLHYSYDDYLQLLEHNNCKLEFCDGVIYAMAGGSIAHGALSVAMTALLRQSLLGRCTVYSSDVKIRIEQTDLSTFPDGSVVCGEVKPSGIDQHAITNPVILVEVTSRSTEDYDRGEKLRNYQQLPSLQVVLIVSHRSREVTVVRRGDGEWEEEICRTGETLRLDSPACSIALDDIYRDVILQP